MRAAIYTRYGPPEVLQIVEMEKPAAGAHEILVRVRATTVTAGDVRMRSFTVPTVQWPMARLYLGVFGPRRQVLGMELAGDVEAVGAEVSRFKPGDPVIASTFAVNFGGYAEYKCLAETGVVARKPSNMEYAEAATLPVGAYTALYILRKAQIRPGQRVMIYGASGSVGTFAVQVACHQGAQVTGVCSTANLALVQGLGAARVIDYTREDVAQEGGVYDVIFDAVGKLPATQARRALAPSGVHLNVLQQSGRQSVADLEALVHMVESGALRAVVDRVYPLEQIVEAHRHVETGHKKGNVVILLAT